MYRSKQDVDKHVESLRSKLSLKEFNIRAYSVARLYFVVGDYASCQKYVEQYISLKGNDAASHKLLGQALQKLGHKDRAIEEFQIALNIDPSHTSLILEICELLADNEVTIDPGRAKYWCDKAEAVFPKHPITFRLRESLVSTGNSEPKALTALLKSELASYPKDVTLHIRLLKHYLTHYLYSEAFDHSLNVEFSSVIINNLTWYQTLYDVLKKQHGNDTNTWQYHLLLLTVHERLCHLSLIETPGSSKSLVESQLYLHQYDQAVEQICKAGAPAGFAEFYTCLVHHHHGQLTLHIAIYLLKKAKKDQLNWREATNNAAPLMLMSWHTKPMVNNIHWLEQASKIQQTSVRRWNLEGSYRCSQSGHYLLQNVQEKSDKFLDMVSQFISNENWKDKLYKKIFSNADELAKIKTSHIVTKAFEEPPLQLPRLHELQEFDLVAQQFNPSSLHHIVWILMNYKNPSHFKCTLFEMLSTTPKNPPNCSPETLNKLDIIAFLHCATFSVLQVAAQSANEKDRPKLLPAIVTDILCPLPQIKWWECAYKFSQNDLGADLSDVRNTLSRGIEVIRGVDKHGLDPDLLCKLGSIFYESAKICIDPIEISSYEQRAALYYSSAIPLLEKCKKNIAISSKLEHRLFDYTQKELNRNLSPLLEESKLFMGRYLFNQSDYEKAIEMLADVKSPKANFYLCQIYKKLAMDEYHDNATPEMKTKYRLLLNNAKKYAYKSLNTVRDCFENGNDLYVETHGIVEDIETKLRKLDNDITNADDYSDLNITPTSSEHNLLQSTIYNNSTPKQATDNLTHYKSAMDSQLLDNTKKEHRYFEKIDHQIRSLQKRDATISNFMEQTKNWVDENRNMGNLIITSINTNMQNTIDQFKLLSLSVDQVKDQIGDCRNECKDVGELKKEVEALKKEINKLKKVPSEVSVDERDLYDSASFTSRLASGNNQSPFNPRMMPQFPLPLTPYHLYSQNLYNLFGSHFAQPPAVPGAMPGFDPARPPPVNFPGLYPPHDQIYADLAHLIPPVVPVTPSVAPSSSVVTAPVVNASTPKSQTSSINKLPVNVVITSSDPLPPVLTTPAPVLSVTIPPEHIKQTVHNYQITMPHNEVKVTSTPTVFPSFLPSTTADIKQSLSLNTPKVTSMDNSNTKLLFVSPKKSDLFNVSDALETSSASELVTPNKSRTTSEKSNTSIENYDPYFKPIMSLPDEVPVVTGEEDETPIFKARAKLYRFVEKEWKERGLGEIKLLKHKTSGRVRVLMRRDQVFNICANHLIIPEMKIQPMKMTTENNDYIWCAHDFAEENVVLEKFCIRFKTADIGKSFYDSFEKARKESELLKDTTPTKASAVKVETKPNEISQTKSETQPKTVVGGFTFSSTPTFKTVKEPEKENIEKSAEKNKTNLFSNFTFKSNMSNSTPFSSSLFTPTTDFSNSKQGEINKDNAICKNTSTSSDVVEEYEPNVEFKPVVPLPALIDHKTGEEDEIVLFEHRAKLMRFDAGAKEWKERGLGNIKILVQEKHPEKIRLLMRREQVLLVCCNHALTKDINFQKMPNTDKAVSWCAKDFSEGELVPETFCLRFKTPQILDEFLAAVKIAQNQISSNSIITKEVKPVKEDSQVGFGDKFKPKAGSWYCETCYTNNLDNFLKCACCGQSKPALNNVTSDTQTSSTTKESGWGDQFKPKPGSWECRECYVQNSKGIEICTVCKSPKDPTAINKATVIVGGNVTKFSFGMPNVTSQAPSKTVGWGDKFKPKADSWECPQCFVRNEGYVEQCVACNSHKDPSKKVETKSILETTPVTKFNFGIPQKQGTPELKNNKSTIFDGSGTHKITFGAPVNENNVATPKMSFTFGSLAQSQPLNFNLTKVQENQPKPSLLSTPDKSMPLLSNEMTGKFEFGINPEIKVTSVKSPKSDKGGESDGNEYASEDDGDHLWFKPVISLPDKVEVVTGEENEDEVFTQRAKLFIYVSETREWKERGLGNVKILVHQETGKHRVLMRREQVHKICLNFALTPDIKFTKKDEKSWMFAANDFSEGELELQQFCLRFSNKEIATGFTDNIAEIQRSKGSVPVKEEIDDIIFVKEIQADPEQKQKAKELLLPENFFRTGDEKLCTGCRGCEDDEDKNDNNTDKVYKNSTPQSNIPSMVPSDNIFKTPLNPISQNTKNTNNINKPLASSQPDDKENNTIKNNIFGQKPSQVTNDLTLTTMLEQDSSPAIQKPFIRAPKLNVANNEVSTFKPKNEKVPEKPVNIFETSNIKFGNIFGTSAKTWDSQKPVFGSNAPLFSNATSTQPKFGNIFGNGQSFGSQQTITGFGALTQNATDMKNKSGDKADENQQKVEHGLFGSKMFESASNQQTGFGALAKNATQNIDSIPLKVDESLSFSALSSNNSGFSANKPEDFKWEGVGQQIFSSGVSKNVSNQSNECENNEDYDPHYEPIVPLPDEIVVSTGEEEEIKLFGERAKLYRSNATETGKEWKERGVGELKILHHPTRNTYRLLLRREQVYKAVLNTLLFHDMELLPMSRSSNAWIWACTNFAEEKEGVQETLAVKFKNDQLANEFRNKVVECTRKLQAAAAQAIRDKEAQENSSNHVSLLRLPKDLQETARVDNIHTEQALQMLSVPQALIPQVSHTVDEDSEDADDRFYDDDENYDENYDDEVEYFVSTGKVVIESESGDQQIWPDGHIQGLYCQTQNAPKVQISDIATGEILTDMILHSHNTIKVEDNSCSWSGMNYITQELNEKITVFFPDAEKAMEFYAFYETCQEMSACQVEELLEEEEEEEE